MSIGSSTTDTTSAPEPRRRGNGENGGKKNAEEAAAIVENANTALFIAIGFDGSIKLYTRVDTSDPDSVPPSAKVLATDAIGVWVTKHAPGGGSASSEGGTTTEDAAAPRTCVTTMIGGQPVTVCR